MAKFFGGKISCGVLTLATLALMPGVSFSQCGNYNFDYAAYAAPATKDLQSPSERLASVVGKLATVAGENGKLLLPAGTQVDSASFEAGFIELKITLPANDPTISQEQAYTAMDVLGYQFKEEQGLLGVHMVARANSDSEYEPIDEFVREAKTSAARSEGPKADDWFEPNGPGPQPRPDYEKWYAEMRAKGSDAETKNFSGQGSTAISGDQFGPLTGITIFTYGGHGRTWDGDATTPYWRWQRGFVNSMMEDFGNVDAAEFFVPFLMNAGATVVPLRPIGYQNNEVIVDNPAATYVGSWTNSTSTRFYGAGTPYRFATASGTETATATYTPNIPAAGYYPIYTWVNYGSDRIPGQLYKILTTGGESRIRVNHRRVGCGWVYLGTYYFAAGSNPATGSVVISNLLPTGAPAGTYVAIADAIRFGNGMGNVNKGGGVSGYSHREESTVYWIQNGWGNGDTANDGIWDSGNAYDDETQSFNAPPKMSAYMNRLEVISDAYKYALYLGWHSNASGGTARGSEGLITTSTTLHQADWAAKVSNEIDTDAVIEDANWEYTWNNRAASTYTGGYGEISNYNFDDQTTGGEMDATIIEVAYHDNVQDAALLRDPKVRIVNGRSAYKAVVRYFNQYQSTPLAFLPEPPVRFRATNNGAGGVALAWAAGPSGGAVGQPATGYRVYRSPDGLGFGQPTVVAGTSTTVTGLTPGQTYYFRIAATNAGGESLPSEVLAVRVRATGAAKILVVNGYDRFDRYNNINRGLSSVVEQLIVERNNSYNYVRQHVAAIAAAGFTVDSCSNEAVISGDVNLNNYEFVDWISGEESSLDKTFDATERTKIQTFLTAGNKKLFVSGAEIGYELDGQAVAASFYNSSLMADYAGDDGGSYQATGVAGTVLAGLVIDFSPGTTMYNVDYPDKLAVFAGSTIAANYTGGGSGGAAIQYTGGSPTRSVVTFGFPFEAVSSSVTRNQIMANILAFMGVNESSTGVEGWNLY